MAKNSKEDEMSVNAQSSSDHGFDSASSWKRKTNKSKATNRFDATTSNHDSKTSSSSIMENDIPSVIMKRFNLNDDAVLNGQQSIKLIRLIVQSNVISM
jgi:hypothetical protein